LTNRPHPRLGDVRDGVVYVYGDGGPVPTEIREVAHERDHQWAVTERRVAFRKDLADDSLLAIPAAVEPAAPADSMRSEPKLSPVAPGLWSLDMEDLDTRSMVVEFSDRLAVIEAAVGSANGERIVDAAKRQWPTKPIRYFFFSHFHPHYAGGLRAFVAEGATIVTTAGNEGFVRQSAQWPFRLRPDRLAKAPKTLQLRTFKKRFELADSTNRLVAVDIGTRSDHTEEFVIFWFPNQRLLFETEQGWVTVDGKLRASRRAEKFLQTMGEEGLTPDRLVQSWPMRGNRAEVGRAELDSLVLARKR
jgi:glyoxylase-like metal-dependent hydrolase (beta-lactamase superfamily II)